MMVRERARVDNLTSLLFEIVTSSVRSHCAESHGVESVVPGAMVTISLPVCAHTCDAARDFGSCPEFLTLGHSNTRGVLAGCLKVYKNQRDMCIKPFGWWFS